MAYQHHLYSYAMDAARLLERCRYELPHVIAASSRKRGWSIRQGAQLSLAELEETLDTSNELLIQFFEDILEQERHSNSSSETIEQLFEPGLPCSLPDALDLLNSVLTTRRLEGRNEKQRHVYYPERNATDSLLFRLIVALELCLVRIDDAHLVVTGRRKHRSNPSQEGIGLPVAIASGVGVGGFFLFRRKKHRLELTLRNGLSSDYQTVLTAAAKVAAVGATLFFARRWWNELWMSAKIVKSTKSISEWNEQWRLVQSTTCSQTDLSSDSFEDRVSLHTKQSQKLVDYASREQPKFSLLQSQGELRFLMLKRAMDVFYASVGAAMGVTRGRSEPDWQLTLATAAAASFYSLTGASRQAAEVTSSSKTAHELIQNAWGMVSRPAIKNLSLQVSKLLKNAAVADRIEICGVSCFVLSADPAPELKGAIDRFQKKYGQKAIRTLSTIDEQEEHTPGMKHSAKPFARSSISTHRQRDVILHLTGGGFFAHIIASDLPYLLDWSAATGAVVICPEYALLPEHTFPDPLNEVSDVFNDLVTGQALSVLGFEVNRIVITGESAGGNLAASLCVKLSMDEQQIRGNISEEEKKGSTSTPVIFPDALMLSCPVLNMSLELSHSRVLGTDDPVLPRGLISAISDAYVPPRLGVSKKNPLASPLYASDAVLRRFPPTLLIASSKDPLLDDSVAFNQRLRSNGVESDLKAAENLPHAYLGLGTAGFPEAVQVQQECQRWLAFQLARELSADSDEMICT